MGLQVPGVGAARAFLVPRAGHHLLRQHLAPSLLSDTPGIYQTAGLGALYCGGRASRGQQAESEAARTETPEASEGRCRNLSLDRGTEAGGGALGGPRTPLLSERPPGLALLVAVASAPALTPSAPRSEHGVGEDIYDCVPCEDDGDDIYEDIIKVEVQQPMVSPARPAVQPPRHPHGEHREGPWSFPAPRGSSPGQRARRPFLPGSCSRETGRCHPCRPTSPGRAAVEFCPRRRAGPRVPPARGPWGGASAPTSGSWTPCPTPVQRHEACGLSQPRPAGAFLPRGVHFRLSAVTSDTCWCSCFAGEGALPGWELGTWWGGPQLPRTPRLLGGEMPLVNSRGSCCHLLSPKKYGEFLQKQVLVFSFGVGVTTWWCRN